MKSHKLMIKPDGTLVCIYVDEIRPLLDHASIASTSRASHVEPDSSGMWVADMSPIGGPSSPPFRLREDALAWEKRWIESNVLSTL